MITEYEDTIIKMYTKAIRIVQEEYEAKTVPYEQERNAWMEEYLAIQQSLSWRITRPVRWFKNVLGRLRG